MLMSGLTVLAILYSLDLFCPFCRSFRLLAGGLHCRNTYKRRSSVDYFNCAAYIRIIYRVVGLISQRQLEHSL